MHQRILAGALVTFIAALGCDSSKGLPSNDGGGGAAGNSSGASSSAPEDGGTASGGEGVAGGGGTDVGDIDCGAGKKSATSSMTTSLTPVLGGWRFFALRSIDGTDHPLEDSLCDPSINYYFVPTASAPTSAPISADDVKEASCTVANGGVLTVLGGTDTGNYPDCLVLSCGSGTLGMYWESEISEGLIYAFDENGQEGSLIARIRVDTLDPSHLLFTQGATTWVLAGGVVPTCE